MSLFEDRLSQAEDRMASIESSLTNLLEENATLRTRLETLTSKFDDLDQASRSCNVEIQNIPEKKAENLVQLSLAIGKLLCVDLKDSNIRSVHPRARRSLTSEQLFGVSVTPGSGSRFFIAEHLTLKNKIISSKARQIAKDKYVWVKNNSIFVRKTDESKVIQLRSGNDLGKIV
ncbi:unnamed protein product [Leptidea sinapis]|uniref:FP protein C-terminal domain-containing protein n=1 Tax=Leptidea sinapis TaxID=189913 RepID=A0A5E4QJ71_9NEOP|nr:unnamed protein product [Leptidea sinapis]